MTGVSTRPHPGAPRHPTIYASDALVKSGENVSIDLYERMPAPFGLIRYGVPPDNPPVN
ncbi:hypothetical protein MTQ17_03280 [Corynebacterium bovis]|uniref:hypothetical protein n=1 Tax=Corynebacterium bovis TaxID=36808 RepID=UPI0031388D73